MILLGRLNITSEFINGKRVTDASHDGSRRNGFVGIGQRPYRSGNYSARRALCGCNRVRKCGLIICDQEDPELGLVGAPTEVNPRLLRDLAIKVLFQ